MIHRLAGCWFVFSVAVVALWAATTTPATAVASTLELYGFGPRAIGLAGAVEASSNGALTTWDNPALLGSLRHPQGGLIGTALLPAMQIAQARGHAQWPAALPGNALLGSLAVASPVGGIFAERVGVGLALHIPMNVPTSIASRDASQPQVPLYEGLASRLVVAIGVGWQVTDWLAVGATGQLLARLDGGGEFRLSALDRRFTDQRLNVDLISRVTATLGAVLTPHRRLRLATVWRDEASVRYRIPLTVSVAEVGDIRMDVAGVGLWSPMSLALSAQWTLAPRWRLMASARWERWSTIPALAPAISLTIDDASLARQSGVPASVIARMQTLPVALAASDIVQPRVGIEGVLRPWLQLRGGLGFRPSPLPRATGSANYLDANSILAGVGASFSVPDPDRVDADALAIDIGLGWTHLLRRTAGKQDAADPVGAVSLEGDAFRVSIGLRHAL